MGNKGIILSIVVLLLPVVVTSLVSMFNCQSMAENMMPYWLSWCFAIGIEIASLGMVVLAGVIARRRGWFVGLVCVLILLVVIGFLTVVNVSVSYVYMEKCSFPGERIGELCGVADSKCIEIFFACLFGSILPFVSILYVKIGASMWGYLLEKKEKEESVEKVGEELPF